MPSDFTLTTLCYVRRGDDVLLMARSKAPNLGQVTAPGGKLAPGESPDLCVVREVREETGLAIAAPRLRAVITQTADDPAERWILFLYFADAPPGEIRTDCPEGRLFWCPVAELLGGGHPIPDADRVFTPWLFEPNSTVIRATFWHRADLTVQRWERH